MKLLIPPDNAKSPTWVRTVNVLIALALLVLFTALKNWFFGDNQYEVKPSPELQAQWNADIRKAQQDYQDKQNEKFREQWAKDHPRQNQ